MWETSKFSCVFPFIAPPLSCSAYGILPKETKDMSLLIQIYRSIDAVLDFVPLERMNACKFRLLPVHVLLIS